MKKHYLSVVDKSMSGFSLLEVLLSVTLLVVIATSTAGALSLGTRGSVRNVERMQALMIAETKMAESRRAYLVDGIFRVYFDSVSGVFVAGNFANEVQFDMPAATGLIVRCFEEDDNTPCAFVSRVGTRRIEVQVDWVDNLGENQTVNMATYAYR